MAGLIKVSAGGSLGPCPLCGAAEGQSMTMHRSAGGALSFLRCVAFAGGRAVEAALLHCAPCDFAYFSPRPDAAFIEGYYRSQAGQGGDPTPETLRRKVAAWSTAQEVAAVAAFLAGHGVRFEPGAQSLVVDVGCGAGEFAAFLHRQGVPVLAVDPGRANCRFIAEEIGCAVAECDVADVPEQYAGRASLVHCKDSLEHHADPVASLAAMGRLLAPGGRLFLSVPNWNSRTLQADAFNHPYFAFPAHLNYFSATALEKALGRAGLRVAALTGTTFVSELFYCAERAIKLQGLRPEWAQLDADAAAGTLERLLVLAEKP